MESLILDNIMSLNKISGHNIFNIDNIIFSSNFDSGNLYRIEKISVNRHDYRIWTANDNMESTYQSKNTNPWFHFSVSGLSQGTTIRFSIATTSSNSGLYKHDMRPVYRNKSTNNKWIRIKHPIKYLKLDNPQSSTQISYEHYVDINDDIVYFAFTYPYSYSELQDDLNQLEIISNDNKIYFNRELLIHSVDKRKVELLTISSYDNITNRKEPLFQNLFPLTNCTCNAACQSYNNPRYCQSTCQSTRSFEFDNKEVVFVSARVHPGEVPAQHCMKGIINLLLDLNDIRSIELRKRYVFKIIPMLNPDGVFRGHFRQDQYGQNLNRYYKSPNITLQPSIYASKTLLDYYSNQSTLILYLDLHAHSSKRGCFIYGNILDNIENQIQNQLFCKLISINSLYFDYSSCLFSKEHMYRIDPSDMASGLTAEGSGRVSTYLNSGIIHSYTLECNYNCNKYNLSMDNIDNQDQTNNLSDKFTPSSYENVGMACIITLLDIKNQNPNSKISKTKYKTINKLKLLVYNEIKLRKEYKKQINNYIYNNQIIFKRIIDKIDGCIDNNIIDNNNNNNDNKIINKNNNKIDKLILNDNINDNKTYIKNRIITLDFNKDKIINTQQRILSPRISTPLVPTIYSPSIEPNNNIIFIPNIPNTTKANSVRITRIDYNNNNTSTNIIPSRPLSSSSQNKRHFSTIGLNFLMGKKNNEKNKLKEYKSLVSSITIVPTKQITVGDVTTNNVSSNPNSSRETII